MGQPGTPWGAETYFSLTELQEGFLVCLFVCSVLFVCFFLSSFSFTLEPLQVQATPQLLSTAAASVFPHRSGVRILLSQSPISPKELWN